MKFRILNIFLLLILTVFYLTNSNYVLADNTVEGRTCPDDKPINLPSGCYTAQEYVDIFAGGFVTVCVLNTPGSVLYRPEEPADQYYRVTEVRGTGSQGLVGLLSDGGIELDNLDDPCPSTSPSPTPSLSPTPTPTPSPSPIPSPTPVPTITPTPLSQTHLGGLSLDEFCHSLGQSRVVLSGNKWSCQPSGNQIDMNAACRLQYDNPNAIAKQLDPNNPFTWQCFASPLPTPSPSGTLVGTFNGFKLYDDGIISGTTSCSDRTTNSSGIHLQQNGRFTDLRWNGFTIATIDPGPNLAVSIQGVAINESSEVVAQLYNSDRPTSLNSTAIFWKNGVTTVLKDTPSSGEFAGVTDINDKGYDVGYLSSSEGLFGKETDLNTNLGNIGTGYVFPRCIDENNVITGDALDFPGFQTHHVHWVPLVPPTDKNPLVPFVAEYFDNQNLVGTPKITRLDQRINFATDGSIDSSFPADHFSARWSKTQFMKAGRYSFTLKADDGIRFWVDNTLVVDDWTNHATRVYTPDILVTGGNHSFKIEYYENTGGAVAVFNEDFPARTSSTPIIIP